LYSREFYEVIKRHLRSGGILEEWFIDDRSDPAIKASAAKTLTQAFRYVRAFPSYNQGGTGIYFLASMDPLPATSSAVLASRMPPAAAADFVEWGPAKTAQQQFDVTLGRELNVAQLIAQAPRAPLTTDDAPVNEYFLLRRWFGSTK
jgi:hypothetical protein